MKKLTIYLFIYGMIVLTGYGCKKANNPCDDSNLKEGYIIGFDQCAAGKQSYETFRYFQTPAFYYAFDEKVSITPSESKILIKYSVAKDQKSAATLIQSIEKNAELNWQGDKVLIIDARTRPAKEKIRERLLAETDVLSIRPVFKTAEGLELGLTDEFVFKFKPSVSEVQINTLNKQYDVTIVKSSEVYQLARVGKGIDVLEVANKYQESGLVIFSHPNFIARMLSDL